MCRTATSAGPRCAARAATDADGDDGGSKSTAHDGSRQRKNVLWPLGLVLVLATCGRGPIPDTEVEVAVATMIRANRWRGLPAETMAAVKSRLNEDAMRRPAPRGARR